MEVITYQKIKEIIKNSFETISFDGFIFNEESLKSKTDTTLQFLEFHSLVDESDVVFLFTNCHFEVNISLNNISRIKNIIFRNCFTSKSISLYNLNFNALHVRNHSGKKEKSFFKVKSCTIKNSSTFYETENLNYIFYNDTIFEKDFLFSNTKGNVSLKLISEHKGNVNISNSSFDYFNMSGCLLPQDKLVDFSNCKIEGLGLFHNIYLGENVKFKNCDLKKSSFLFSVFNKAFFTSSKFEENVYKYVDLHLWEICGENLLQLHSKERSLHELFLRQINFAAYFDDEIMSLVCDPHDIITTVRMFEANLDSRKDVELSGNFHKMGYEFRYLYDKINFKNQIKKLFSFEKNPDVEKKSFLKIVNEGFRAFLFFLYKKFSLFGESYTRSFIWIMFIISICSGIYLITGIKYTEISADPKVITTNIIKYSLSFAPDSIANFLSFSWLSDYLKCLGYSIISSTPLKIDATRLTSGSDITSIISTTQLIIQLILITLFIAAIRRKFKRN